MPYSVDADLVKVQNNILELGFSDWSDQHIESESVINRAIRVDWFNGLAIENGYTSSFDESLLLTPEQLNRSSVYKTLELIYLFLISNSDGEDYKEKYELFKNLYEIEIESAFKSGLDYDWDGSGSIESNEQYLTTSPRRLIR